MIKCRRNYVDKGGEAGAIMGGKSKTRRLFSVKTLIHSRFYISLTTFDNQIVSLNYITFLVN
ncbi:hypothetical protein SAMN05192574_105212 [Mucilaginibacter gossypiicola]|uniref:Uncharacterized protein n=1 Tax=Mucilaginibacter gossypiicola TaxID=551995 RepID=A0A1H8LRV7_9SPHI|nr:hypothetical protein SAMN05192574_105212 [Mucilaginibacter gossypiicola]